MSPAAIAAGALIATAGIASLLGGMPRLLTVGAGVVGALIVVLSVWRRQWEVPLHALAVTLLASVTWWADRRLWWIAALTLLFISGTFWIAVTRARRGVLEAEAKSETLASQLDRRISELFSLQELSYVLSESIQLDRMVDQVARYAARFLEAEGAIVVVAEDEAAGTLRVVGASGTLESLLGSVSKEVDTALVRFAIGRERIEVAQGLATPSVNLIAGTTVRSAAVAPLRSQGVTMGALAVADRQGGPFTTEDLWLLSTVATNASVTLANSRLYEMVRRSKEEWETAFNALTEGIAVVSPAGAIQRANRALATLADVPEGELVGRDFHDTVFGGAAASRQLVDAAYRGERPAPQVIRWEGGLRSFRLTVAPLADRGEGGSVVVLVEDVTDQRLMEAQLIQNDKMASIGQLVSGVAHELNNPLTSIAGLAELLLERTQTPGPLREHLRVIHDQAERAGRIVRNLLTFARKGVPEKSAVDLNDVVARTSLLIVYELQLHGIELESALSPEPVDVLGDRYELQQVLLNLVTNAVQAVSGLEPAGPRRIVLGTSRADGQAVLSVCDSGAGVPPHLVSHLFTPFFTTKAPGEGTGLGLSLSYGMVQAHGGALTYQSPPDGGAEFRVTLPLMTSTTPQVSAGPAVADRRNAALDRPAHRILLVDDDPGTLRVVSALFTAEGHTVETAQTGEQGLLMVERGEYDLIVADVRASVGSDQLFVDALLAGHPEAWRRLVLSGPADTPMHDRVPGLPVHRITKPFNLRELRLIAARIFESQPTATV